MRARALKKFEVWVRRPDGTLLQRSVAGDKAREALARAWQFYPDAEDISVSSAPVLNRKGER